MQVHTLLLLHFQSRAPPETRVVEVEFAEKGGVEEPGAGGGTSQQPPTEPPCHPGPWLPLVFSAEGSIPSFPDKTPGKGTFIIFKSMKGRSTNQQLPEEAGPTVQAGSRNRSSKALSRLLQVDDHRRYDTKCSQPLRIVHNLTNYVSKKIKPSGDRVPPPPCPRPTPGPPACEVSSTCIAHIVITVDQMTGSCNLQSNIVITSWI